MINHNNHVLIFFLDGVGMGGDDPSTNPFTTAELPILSELLGEGWYIRPSSGGPGRISREWISLAPTDPNLNVPGRPQSASGQAALLTGRNVPELIGEHYGPKPNPAIAAILRNQNLFMEVMESGGRAALLTPYPQGYFEAIESGKRLLSSVPLAAVSAGIDLMTADDLRAGRAVSPGFTGQGWHDYLGYKDIPLLTLEEAGRQIASLAREYQLSFFEHWPSDRSGHRGSLEQAIDHIEMVDQVLGGLFDSWDRKNDLLIITSDHGNIEEKDHRLHSRNPVPTILYGAGHDRYARQVRDLTDIASVIRSYLEL